MKKLISLFSLCFLASLVFAQSPQEQIKRVCLDYIEGFYEADTLKLLRSIKPSLYKIGFYKRKGSNEYTADKMTLEDALRYARKDIAENRKMGKKDSPKKVLVLDIMKVTAVAKITALWGSDYLLLSKQGDKWMIEEVIWEGE
jgi:hypothetical protein